MFLKPWYLQYQDKADEGGDGAGGTAEDRGDELSPEDAEDKPEDAKPEDKKPEPEAKEPEDKKDDDDDDEPRIPKSRLDAKNRLLRAERRAREEAERKLQAIEAEKDSKRSDDSEDLNSIDAMEAKLDEIDNKIIDARADGDKDAEKELRKESRKLERRIQAQLVDEAATRTAKKTVYASEYDQVLDTVEEEYPELDPDESNSKYDQDKVLEVRDLAEAFEAKGASPAEALLRAVSYAFPGRDSSVASIHGRRRTNVKKNSDTEARTPPDLDKAGKNSDRGGKAGDPADVHKLSEEEFDALPNDVRARMRGDIL